MPSEIERERLLDQINEDRKTFNQLPEWQQRALNRERDSTCIEPSTSPISAPPAAETRDQRIARHARAAIKAELIECWGVDRGTAKFNALPWDKMIADPYIDRGYAIARAIEASDRDFTP